MNISSIGKRLIAVTICIGIVAAMAAGAYFTAPNWWPPMQKKLLALLKEEEKKHEDHEEDPDVLKVSEQAQASMNVRIEPLRRDTYQRTTTIPGQVVTIPGISQHDITVKSSGKITRIFVRQGQIVHAGDKLFEIALTHEEAIQTQLQLLDALAKLEVVNAEIDRLEKLLKSSPGAVPGTRLLKQRYERGHLKHTLASRRQILLLLGLPQSDVDGLIDRHKRNHMDAVHEEGKKNVLPPLLDRLTVYAPQAEEMPADRTTKFVLEELMIRQGQQVGVGVTLCRLGDYSRLHIKGLAFQRDLETLRMVKEKGWGVTVATTGQNGRATLPKNFPIEYIGSSIDPQSRAANFYVELENPLLIHLKDLRHPYADWQYRPGQRVEINVPLQRYDKSLIVPAAAVVRDGLENYIFQKSGDTFLRRKVSVRYRSKDIVVLGEDADVFEGASLAMSGAYQLQLALVNRAGGAADPHAGHTH